MLAIAMAMALIATASGCGLSFFFPVVEESTPIPDEVDAALEPYYTQVLSWDQCGEFLCATARAPLDWEDPAAEEIELALIRQPAKQEKLGSLLVNPGGPGASGYDFVADSIDFAVTEAVQDRYDIVGFDPRGVGRSSAVTCFEPSEMDQLLFSVSRYSRGSNEWITGQNELTHTFGQACLTGTGALLANVDTVSAARDLDLLRAILGEAQLDYLGYSYGAYLGTVYAGTYPDKVGRMVLDGPIDPALGDAQVTLAQAQGLETALRSYLATCMPAATCPFQGTVDDAMAMVRGILDAVAKNPIPSTDGRTVGVDTLLIAIAAPLYNAETWPVLDSVFSTVLAGQADVALSVADGYYGRTPGRRVRGQPVRGAACRQVPRLPGPEQRVDDEGAGQGPAPRPPRTSGRTSPTATSRACRGRSSRSGFRPRSPRRAPRPSSSSAPPTTRRRRTRGPWRSEPSSRAASSSPGRATGTPRSTRATPAWTRPSSSTSSTGPCRPATSRADRDRALTARPAGRTIERARPSPGIQVSHGRVE